MKIKFLICTVISLFTLASCEVDPPFEVITSENSILINGDIDNRIIFGGIAGGAGIIPTFTVKVGAGISDVTITNRYRTPTLPAADPDKTKVLGTFPVANGEAVIPDILISSLRDAADAAITTTGNASINTFLISAGDEKRNFTVSLSNTFILVNGDVYTPYIDANASAGISSFDVRVTTNNTTVTVTHRYSLPGSTTLKDQPIGTTFSVDGTTGVAVIPTITIADLRQPTDPDITGTNDVGQNFLRITSGGVTKSYTIVWGN